MDDRIFSTLTDHVLIDDVPNCDFSDLLVAAISSFEAAYSTVPVRALWQRENPRVYAKQRRFEMAKGTIKERYKDELVFVQKARAVALSVSAHAFQTAFRGSIHAAVAAQYMLIV